MLVEVLDLKAGEQAVEKAFNIKHTFAYFNVAVLVSWLMRWPELGPCIDDEATSIVQRGTLGL